MFSFNQKKLIIPKFAILGLAFVLVYFVHLSDEANCTNDTESYMTLLWNIIPCSKIDMYSKSNETILYIPKNVIKNKFVSTNQKKHSQCSLILEDTTNSSAVKNFRVKKPYEELLGSWNCENKNFSIRKLSFPKIINGYVVKTTTAYEDEYYGFTQEILRVITSFYNFSLELIPVPEGQFGEFINNSWTGMIGLLTTNKAEVATAVTPTKQRSLYINFSPHYDTFALRLIFRKLDTKSTWDFLKLVKPFQKRVWIFIFVITSITVTFLILSNYAATRFPITIVIPMASTRILLLNYCLFGLIIHTCYTGRLTSILAVVKYEVPFHSMQELTEKKDYFPVVVKNWAMTNDIKTSKIEPWISGWKLVLANAPQSMVDTFEEAVDAVFTLKAAFLFPKRIFFKLVPSNCSFDFAQNNDGTLIDSLAYSKEFPYKELFNVKLIQLRQTGIISAQHRRYYFNDMFCPKENFVRISLDEIIELMIIIIFGLGWSLIVCLIELTIYN